MEERRPPGTDDRLQPEQAGPRPSPPRGGPGPETWLAAPAVGIVAVVCCAGPLLVAALTTGGGAWLAAHGYTVGAGAVIVVVAVLGWRIRARLSRA
jgi:hypothetical protein